MTHFHWVEVIEGHCLYVACGNIKLHTICHQVSAKDHWKEDKVNRRKEAKEVERSNSHHNELWGLAYLSCWLADWRVIRCIINEQSAIGWQKAYQSSILCKLNEKIFPSSSHGTLKNDLVSLHLYRHGHRLAGWTKKLMLLVALWAANT